MLDYTPNRIHYARADELPEFHQSATDYVFGGTYQGTQKEAYLTRYRSNLNRWWKQVFGTPIPNPRSIVQK